MADSRKPDYPASKGLTRGHAKPAAPRPARGPVRILPPIGDPTKFEHLKIGSRRGLTAHQNEIMSRINANPEFGVMMLINPVLAMKDLGVELATGVIDHVLHRLQHPPKLVTRREALEATLTEKLGEMPRPQDPAWVSRLLFEKLQLKPLATAGKIPHYLRPMSEEVLDRLRHWRPKPKSRYPNVRRSPIETRLTVSAWTPAVRRLDLKTSAPQIDAATEVPKEVTLEDLYFYKDLNDTARMVLELGVVQRQSFPFHTPDTYRRIRAGDKSNAFRAWIRAVHFPEQK